jgi:uncharacterized membrane protein YidH (DUF202 family)
VQEYSLPILLAIFGGIIIGIMTFLETYSHFPKMEKQERIEFSAKSSTIMAAAIMAALFIAMYLLMKMILK